MYNDLAKMDSWQSSVSTPSKAFESAKTRYLKAVDGSMDLVGAGSGKCHYCCQIQCALKNKLYSSSFVFYVCIYGGMGEQCQMCRKGKTEAKT